MSTVLSPSIPEPAFGPNKINNAVKSVQDEPSSPGSSSSSIEEQEIAVKNGKVATQGIREARKSSFAQSKQTLDANKHADAGPETLSRPKTFLRAAYKLYTLEEAQVAAFMDSYVIYSLDWKDEAAMRTALGDNFQQRVGDCLQAYYSIMNHLCALGDTEKMYIPPLIDRSLSVSGNQLRYEETIAEDLGLKAGDRVLDLGCGRGRVAAHMSSYVPGIHVTGLNIDADQVMQARPFNQALPNNNNNFVQHDFNDLPLPFEDSTFDAFYEIQALSLCREPEALFADLYRILKPGARFSLLDWVSLPAYDPSDEKHADLMRRVKPLIGAVGTPTPVSLEAALRRAGFEVVRSDNPSIDGLQAPLIDKVDVYFQALRKIVLGLVRVRLLPRHLKTLFDRLCLDGQAFVEMDQMRLATTTYRIIAVKPGAN